MSGHVHTYERILHEGVQFIVTGGGDLRDSAEAAGAAQARELWHDGLVRPFHYLRLHPDDAHRRLAVETPYLSDGGTWTVGDRFELAARA